MSVDAVRALKQTLLNEYEHFSDKRIKKLDSGKHFIVDGRTRSDIGSDGAVYGWFCSMFLEVIYEDEVVLSIINCPSHYRVEEWFKEYATPFGRGGQSVVIRKGEQSILDLLAARVDGITNGSRYSVPHYKYAVPRVVSSLNRLEKVLRQAWSQ